MVDSLSAAELGPQPLVIDEDSGRMSTALSAAGLSPSAWHRRATAMGTGEPWPAPGHHSSALVRLPKSKDALDFALHAAAAVLPAGAVIVIFGANDEGIRSAAAHLDAVATDIQTLVTRRHCRVIAGRRKHIIEGHHASLAAWRHTGVVTLLGRTRPWISYPGVFAKGTLDDGTRLLIDSLAPIDSDARVLDFAAGTGIIAAAVLAQLPDAHIDVLEIDSLALEAARENLSLHPNVRFISGATLADAPALRYELILSNPPIHDGVREDHSVLAALIAAAPERLTRGGELRIVVQRRVNAGALIETAFGRCDRILETGQFRILSGRTR